MKRLLFNGLLITLCGCTGADTTSKQLSGVYFQLHTNEFGQTWDTVEIKPLPGKNMYQVYSRIYSEMTVDGKKSTRHQAPPPELAQYDATRQVLLIEGDPTYAVDLSTATLKKGKGEFHKVK